MLYSIHNKTYGYCWSCWSFEPVTLIYPDSATSKPAHIAVHTCNSATSKPAHIAVHTCNSATSKPAHIAVHTCNNPQCVSTAKARRVLGYCP